MSAARRKRSPALTPQSDPDMVRMRRELEVALASINARIDTLEDAPASSGGVELTTDTPLDVTGAAAATGTGTTAARGDHRHDINVTATLDTIDATRGTILSRGAAGWVGIDPGTSGYALTSNGPGADPTYQAAGGIGVAQGTVDFGSVSDYAEVTIAATWVTTGHRIVAAVRGGTADHPLADEDAALEELRPVVTAITASTSITVGVHAPNTTTGQYLVDVLGAA